MTDEELDALVYFLRLAYNETQWTDHLRAGEAADAITTLRTQLAAANARADRAEAERAAQIDRAAAIARLEAIAQAAENAGLPDRRDGLRDAIFALSTIPAVQHAALAEAREKALREAAELCRGHEAGMQFRGNAGWALSKKTEGAGTHSGEAYSAAILAMIDKP